MTSPKPFQKDTIKAALRTLQRPKMRRFLIADEVGLGKTVVAQQIIYEMMKKKSSPLVVFYICSNLSIATQNRAKLLEILETQDERAAAQCMVDRLTLLPAERRPSHPKLNLYTLTPDTSMPMRAGKRRDGRAEERALIHNLVKGLYPHFLQERGENFFQRGATRAWKWLVEMQHQKAKDKVLVKLFNRSVCKEFGIASRHQAASKLCQTQDDLEIIVHLRNALAAIAVEEIKPDLVIFDEFQRFRDVITAKIDDANLSQNLTAEEIEEIKVEHAALRVLRGLRGDQMKSPPALLLLSATPYRLYSNRWEVETIGQNHKEFFELVEFLYGSNPKIGKEKRAACEASFQRLQDEIRKGILDSDQARQAREEVEALLRPIIARTERALLHQITPEEEMQRLLTDLHPDDLLIYKHLSNSLAPAHKSSAVPFWISVPMAMQFMGPEYTTWKNAYATPADGTPGIDKGMRDHFEAPATWPHPRLRRMLEEQETSQLAMPWLAPSLPWWNLGHGWQENSSKILLFSRFQAVPSAIAGLVSYQLERTLLSNQPLDYSEITERKRLQARASQQNMLAIFTPWPWIIQNTEPLAAKGKGWHPAIDVVKQQIQQALQELGIGIADSDTPNRQLWELLVQIEIKAGHFNWVLACWQRLHSNIQSARKSEKDPDAGLGRLLLEWQQITTESFTYITNKELSELVKIALQGVGNVVGRALQRHWPDACTQVGYYHTIDVAWNGLRNYLDQRWFVQALQGERNYPSAIQRAVRDGNLEAVLDEHLWVMRQLHSLDGVNLAKNLRDAIRLRSSTVRLHPLGDKTGGTFTLRCHVAIPYTRKQQQFRSSDSDEEKPLRADELRAAFNTPFWPNILATTSIGQEGLDFHVWCDTLVHWDLCRNPVDLEQREGRIQRYGGLAVRRAIAKRYGKKALKSIKPGSSPWNALAVLAENARPRDPSGLSPWWIFQEARIHRYLFDIPLSEQEYHLAWLQKQRLLYRLVLGQPNQEDLLEYLATQKELDLENINQFILNLSPYFSKKGRR